MVRERLGESWRKNGYAIKKGARTRTVKRGGATHPPPLPTYEVVAASAEEFIHFVETHVDATLFGAKMRQKFREEVDKFKEQMEAEKEAELEAERVRVQMERVKKQLGYAPAPTNSISQLEPISRSRRSRQQVNYSFSEYDELIDDALREQPTRRSARVEQPPPPRLSRGERLSARSAGGTTARTVSSQKVPSGPDDDQAVVVEVAGAGGNNPFEKFSMDGTDDPTATTSNHQRMANANAHVVIAESDEEEDRERSNEVVMGTQDSGQKVPEAESDYEPESDKEEDEDVSEGGSDYEGSESASGSESEGLW
jgi:hypothetical protein